MRKEGNGLFERKLKGKCALREVKANKIDRAIRKVKCDINDIIRWKIPKRKCRAVVECDEEIEDREEKSDE